MGEKKFKDLRIFTLNDKQERFNELNEYIPMGALLAETGNVWLFLNDNKQMVWIWLGLEITYKQRFLAPLKANIIRDLYGHGYTIKTAEQGDEPLAFKYMVGSDISVPEGINKEVYINQSITDVCLSDNRGNKIFISNEYFLEFKKQINKIKV